ncbi:fungal specific transcription factor domain-containing protein [Penicillium brasilianum]|uniref:Fungal specific transcription factor domain-containing protein n=1 Tax=Penicillium brasilianum TaxID=104259 RepID=A0A1S9S0W9_PENBI|nr:fungal specific transcription factor domain-containing protein [Penicillium brasilianum]
MDERLLSNAAVSNPSQKRTAEEIPGTIRPKRAKYASAACTECKRCKVKCIQLDDDACCQRCATMHIPCVVVQTAMQATKDKKERQRVSGDSHYKQLSDDVASLRRELTALTATVKSLLERVPAQSSVADCRTPCAQPTCRVYNSTTSLRSGQPREPQFVGPTRSAFSFNIAETALTRMGILTDQHISTAQSSNASSREPTPEPSLEVPAATFCSESDCLLSFSDVEVARLIGVYQEEVVCCHPILDTELLVLNFPHILQLARHPDRLEDISPKLDTKDVHMLRIVIATAITTEPQGKGELCDKLIAAVEQDVGSISSTSEVELKDIQIMAMLSIYFCHIEEELFAWRAIGRAARQCLEMGLHRKQSLFNHFKDADARNFAIQVFWVVYELDRRWSFGTSLSFALDDRDIDPKLPEPDGEHSYLMCMVSYARLCSRVWEALPPYGSSSQGIPKEKEDYLEFVTQNWLLSIPEELQFRHPRLGLAPRAQPRILHRLRTLCYLRGNYMRLLIHRHHVLNPDNIKADMQSARLVVDIAKDSIEVLVHLNGTSDIYVRQQSIYHFYLLSGLAIMLLAVCHAPIMFSEACKDPFMSGVELVKGFSRHSSASRRLWKSIRGLLPVISDITETAAQNSESWEHDQQQDRATVETICEPHSLWTDNNPTFNGDFGTSIPDVFDLSNNLMDLYNAFGSTGTAQPMQPEAAAGNLSGQVPSGWETEEISRHFQGLI